MIPSLHLAGYGLYYVTVTHGRVIDGDLRYLCNYEIPNIHFRFFGLPAPNPLKGIN
jgi:hypothetical protein